MAPALLDSAGNIVAEASALEVDLAAGKSREVSNYIVSFSPVASEAGSEVVPLQPGNYTLTVINTANRKILTAESEELPVTLEEKPSSTTIEVTDFKVNDGEEITEGSSAEFRFLLTCREGYIDKDIYIFIFKDGERYDVKSHTFAPPLLSAGESKTESALIDLSPLAGQIQGLCILRRQIRRSGSRLYNQGSDCDRSLRHQRRQQPGIDLRPKRLPPERNAARQTLYRQRQSRNNPLKAI